MYLGTAAAVLDPFGPCAEETVVAVDVRELDARQLNPDEDVFWSSMLAAELGLHGLSDAPGASEGACGGAIRAEQNETVRRFGLEDPQLTVWDGTGARAGHRYRSYGQRAQANRLGDNPEHTRLSLERYGVIAHHGRVPAHVLRLAPLDELYEREASDARAAVSPAM